MRRGLSPHRSIWRGKVTSTKTAKGRAPVPVIPQLAEMLDRHRVRCGNPHSGPILINSAGKPEHGQCAQPEHSAGAEPL